MSQQHENMPLGDCEGDPVRNDDNKKVSDNAPIHVPEQSTEQDRSSSVLNPSSFGNDDSLANNPISPTGQHHQRPALDSTARLPEGEAEDVDWELDYDSLSGPFGHSRSRLPDEGSVQGSCTIDGQGVFNSGDSGNNKHQLTSYVGHDYMALQAPMTGNFPAGSQGVNVTNPVQGRLSGQVQGQYLNFSHGNNARFNGTGGIGGPQGFPVLFNPYLPHVYRLRRKPSGSSNDRALGNPRVHSYIPSFDHPWDNACDPAGVPSKNGVVGGIQIQDGQGSPPNAGPSQIINPARASRFGHLSRFSSDVPGHQHYTSTNLPHILFQLDCGPQRKLKTVNPRAVIVDGVDRRGPNDKPVLKFSCLPDHISAWVEGWLLEFWWREDDGMDYDHIISRMDEDEVIEWQEQNPKSMPTGDDATPKKAAGRKSEGGGRKLETKWNLKPKGEMFKKLGNALNMRRSTECRDVLGIRSWIHRRGEGKITGPELKCVERLSQEQIDLNTTLEVKEEGLEVVRIDFDVKKNGKSENRHMRPTGEFLPREYFLGGAQPGDFEFSERMKEILKWIADHNRKARDKGLNDWKDLQPGELPSVELIKKMSRHYVDPKGKKQKRGREDEGKTSASSVKKAKTSQKSNTDMVNPSSATRTIPPRAPTTADFANIQGAGGVGPSSVTQHIRAGAHRQVNFGPRQFTASTRTLTSPAISDIYAGTPTSVNDENLQEGRVSRQSIAPTRPALLTSGTSASVNFRPAQPFGGPAMVAHDMAFAHENNRIGLYFEYQVIQRFNIRPEHPHYYHRMRELVNNAIAIEQAAINNRLGGPMYYLFQLHQLRRRLQLN